MKTCRTGIEFHEYESVPVLFMRKNSLWIYLGVNIKIALTFLFPIPIIIRYIGVIILISKKNFDGDSSTKGKSKESRGWWKPGESSLDTNITPEFPAEDSRSGRIFCVKGKHMSVCGNGWCSEDRIQPSS